MKLNVLKQASLPDALTAELARRYHLVELTALTDADFRALAGTFTVLITNGEATVTRALIASLPALELIAVFGVGYDGVDVQAAAEHQVRVSHTPGVLTDDVADLALGLMLATSRQIVAAHKFIEAGEWAAGGFPWTQKSPVRGSASWAWGASARPSPGAARGSPCRLLIMTASVSRR
jgi:lactate dehydrogenase-like 2-hydroxyacid dehydrogenase